MGASKELKERMIPDWDPKTQERMSDEDWLEMVPEKYRKDLLENTPSKGGRAQKFRNKYRGFYRR